MLKVASARCVFKRSMVFLPQDEGNMTYEQTSDVRSQLRFFEALERMEKQRKDEQEREILLKAAKVQNAPTATNTFPQMFPPVYLTI